MTVTSEQSRIQYEADGVSVSFPVPFRFIESQHLRVSRLDGDTTSTLVLGSDYTVSGANNPAGGSITTLAAYPAGNTISIERIVPVTQETAYQRNDPFPERAHEQALDKLTMICQMLASIFGITPGSQNRALLLGTADLNGQGSYRANGNRIQDLGDPLGLRDAVHGQWVNARISQVAIDGAGQVVVERLADPTDPENGASMIARSAVIVNKVADLQSIPDTVREPSSRYVIKGSIWRYDADSDDFLLESPTAPITAWTGGPVEDFRDALLEAIDYSAAHPGVTITGEPGVDIPLSGRIQMKPGSAIDFGLGADACIVRCLTPTAGIDMSPGSTVRYRLTSGLSDYVGPALDVNDANWPDAYGGMHRRTTFDVNIDLAFQPGSVGVRMKSAYGDRAVAWVFGRADVWGAGTGLLMEASSDGYVNENWIDVRVYSATDYVRMIKHDPTAGVDANRLRITTQPSSRPESRRALYCNGQMNQIELMSWDWHAHSLAPGVDGSQVLFDTGSLDNRLTGAGGRPTAAELIIDRGARNDYTQFMEGRKKSSAEIGLLRGVPGYSAPLAKGGDVDDYLAYYHDQYPGRVTVMGTAVANARNMFIPGGSSGQVSGMVSTVIDISLPPGNEADVGFSAMGINFGAPPDEVVMYVSLTAAAEDWVMVYANSNIQGQRQHIHGDSFGFGARRIRFALACYSQRAVSIERIYMYHHGLSARRTSYLESYRPDAIAAYLVNGTKVIGPQLANIPNANPNITHTSDTVNLILAALRAHGLISPT